MLVYSTIFFLDTFLSYVKNSKKKYIVYLVIILLALLSGTRYYMGGSDVYVYEAYFDSAPDLIVILKNFFSGIYTVEPGFILINSIIKSLGFNFFGASLIYSIIFYVLMYNGLKRFVKEWSVLIAVFMYKLMFYNTFISIRQGLTIAIFFFSIRYIIERKPIQYFLICMCAFFVHRASIFLFFIYFIQYIPVSKNKLIYASLIFLPTIGLRKFVNFEGIITDIISLIGFSEKSSGWTMSIDSISLIHTLELYIVIFAIVVFYNKFDFNKPEQKIFLQFIFILIPLFTLFSDWIIFTRLKDYLVISYGILLGYICSYGNVFKNNSYLIIRFLVYLACFLGMTRYVWVFDNGHLMNYENFILLSKSIFK